MRRLAKLPNGGNETIDASKNMKRHKGERGAAMVLKVVTATIGLLLVLSSPTGKEPMRLPQT